MQYRFGSFISTGAALNIDLGFIPSKFQVYNYSKWATSDTTIKSEWFQGMPNASALATGKGTNFNFPTLVTTNGFTPYSTGALYTNTNYTITGIVKATGVVTVTAIGSIVNGDIVTISSVVGMTQLNTNRYLVIGVSGNTFKLADLFGNQIDMTAFGTYVSGGIANIISTPIVAPVVSSVTGLVITQGQPPGNQYDLGVAGITLGTTVVGVNTDVMYWEAFLMTPTGY